MFIIYVIDLLTKIQCKDGVSYFYKNKKYRPLEKEKRKKIFFSYLVSEIPNFWYMRFFQEMLNVSSGHFLTWKIFKRFWNCRHHLYQCREINNQLVLACFTHWSISIAQTWNGGKRIVESVLEVDRWRNF